MHHGRFYRGTHTRTYARARARMCVCAYVHARVYRVGPGTAPPRIPDVTTLVHLARRTLEMSPLSPRLPLFRVSRSVGARRAPSVRTFPLSLYHSLSLFPSSAHRRVASRRRPAIYSRSSSGGQSRRSRHGFASHHLGPFRRRARGMARHGVRSRGTVPRGFSRVSTTILAAVLRTYASPPPSRSQRACARARMPSLASLLFLRRLAFISR